MSIASNFPAIKPSLNLDFANTKMLDSRVTFTRASTGTYYNGVTTAKAEENLLLRSQDYSATWTVTSLTPVTSKTAPDSTSTATEFTATAANAVLTQGYTAIAGAYTFSVWLRRVTGTGDIQIAADNGTWTTKVITGTWARYDVTQTVAAGSKTAGVRVVTSTDAIEVWGAQLEQRSVMTAYTATTTQAITNYIPVLLTAQSGVPRFDHNPTTDESLGLLIEESRTNLLTYSEQINLWSSAGGSITANTQVAPDGTQTAETLTGLRYLSPVVASSTYTFSCYAKKVDGNNTFSLRVDTPSSYASVFNLEAGTVSTNGTGMSGSITNVGNGWYRCSTTFTYAVTNAVLISSNSGSNSTYVWGAQLEAGAFATSYIKTEAATVTRAADAASMTGTNFSSWFSNAEGTMYVDVVSPQDAALYVVSISDGTNNNRIELFNWSSRQGQIVTDNVDQALFDNGTIQANFASKIAIAYATNNSALSLNAGAASADTSCLMPVVNRIFIGGSALGGVASSRTIKKLAYYPMRVTNAQLQALTS